MVLSLACRMPSCDTTFRRGSDGGEVTTNLNGRHPYIRVRLCRTLRNWPRMHAVDGLPIDQTRIENVAQPVAKQIKAEHGVRDRQAGKHGD